MGSESKNEGTEGLSLSTKKVVQSLKEIVKHCTEQEIYAVLKECNMDPNEAAQLLLSQDTFHEVKSKRERRKEMKDTQESWSRGNNSGLNCGVTGNNGTRNVGRSGPTQISYNELGKAADDGEKGSIALSFSSSITHVEGKTMNQQTLLHSDSFSIDNRRQSIGTGDPISASAQLSPGFQSTWLGATRVRPSMADVLKMGRPQNKGSQMLTVMSCTPQDAVTLNSSLYCTKHPQDLHPQDLSYVLESINESGVSVCQHVLNECPVIEEPTANSGSYVASDAEISCNQSNSHDNGANLFRNCASDVVQLLKGDVSENLDFDPVRSASASSRQIIMNNAGGASDSDNDMLKDISSCSSYVPFKLQEGSGSHISCPNHSAPLTDDTIVDMSSAAATLHRLSLRNEEPAVPVTDDNCAVVFPCHLQALAADCSQLSFGTYKAGSNSTFSEPLGSNPLNFDRGKTSAAFDGSYGHLDSRNLDQTGDEQLRSMYDTLTVAADARNYDSIASSQQELMKHIIPGAEVGHEFITQSCLSGSDFNNTQQPTSAFSVARADSQIRNLPAFSSELHTYSDTMRNDLLASTIKSLRGSDDLLHSPFPVTRSIPSICKTSESPLSSSTNSLLKVLKPAAFSKVQSSSVHPHHLCQPYSQPNLTYEQLANGIAYPSVSRSNAYMPSALDRAYPGNSTSDQSLAGTKYSLSQYNSGGPSSRLPLPASNSSGYGSFGGRFLHNPPTDLPISYSGYDDVLRSNYMGGNQFTPFQQHDSFSEWDYGPGDSRTMSSVPNSTYYSLVEQNQQSNRYRYGQQYSQHHGAPGYPDFSHS